VTLAPSAKLAPLKRRDKHQSDLSVILVTLAPSVKLAPLKRDPHQSDLSVILVMPDLSVRLQSVLLVLSVRTVQLR